MKKYLGIFLCICCFLFYAMVAVSEEITYDDLNDLEKQIFDSVLAMSDDFAEPYNLRILEMGQYFDMSEYRDPSHEYFDLIASPDSIGIKVSGHNVVMNQINGYYKLYLSDWCHPTKGEEHRKFIKQGQDLSSRGEISEDEAIISSYYSYLYYSEKGFYMAYGDDADFGEKLKDEKQKPNASIANINNALKAYWAELGL